MLTHPYGNTVAQALSQIKDEDEIWGEITTEMQARLKELLEDVLESERDLMVACPWYQRDQCQRRFSLSAFRRSNLSPFWRL
jgi:hypothetical protein